MAELVITVSGGCVRSVYSSEPDLRVVVIDWDAIDQDDADEYASVPSDEVQQDVDELLHADDQRAVIVDWNEDSRLGVGWSTIRIDRNLVPYEVG